LLLLLLARERRDHALPLLLDVFGEPGMTLLDEAGCEAELQQGDCEDRGEVVEIGARFRELHRFDGFVEELLHGIVQLAFEKLGLGHGRFLRTDREF
jgi:hypothetical protein